MNWVQEELKHADLGDVRRNKRLIKIVEDLSSQQCRQRNQSSKRQRSNARTI